ncbi:hypothetical protein ACE7GA_01950 [Roseomonas sp. CCTCC AB2023176]|uniref:hypothetical protein n=1 Tax=Roseomonas sp. CCTCC AB2023176 TaxID=3342640 RepID=UPI0035DA7F55
MERQSGALLWAESYDRALPEGELPIALDDIVSDITGAVTRRTDGGLSSAA